MSGTTISVSAFKVDLRQFREAISSVKASAHNIDQTIYGVNQELEVAESLWASPGASTLFDLVPQLTNDMQTLQTLLHEMVQRLQSAYDNYSSIELDNITSLTFG